MKRLLILGTLFFSSTLLAKGFCVEPYVGIEGKMRYSKFAKDFGKQELANKLPEAGVIAGVKLNDYLALEAGATLGKSKTQKSGIKSKVHGLSLTALGLLPLGSFEPFVGVGISHINQIFQSTGADTFKINKSKGTLRFLGGIQYALTESLKLRAAVSHENLRKLKLELEEDTIKPLRALNGHLGLLLAF